MPRTLFSIILIALAAPLIVASSTAVADASAWQTFEASRIGALLLNSLALAAISAAIAVPLGTLAALALERTAIPFANALRGLAVVWLFVPLPVLAVAWQIVLGSWLPSIALEPGAVAWRPWAQGLLPAGIVHGLAALPWVIVIASAGLRSTDRALEEEAITSGGPRRALALVLLPRVKVAALAALAWVIVQTSTEIPITDAMMVRTYAEEVYTQIVGPGGVNAAVLATLPAIIIACAIAMFVVKKLGLAAINPEAPASPIVLRVSLSVRIASVFSVYSLFAIMIALPLAALVWKCGTLEQFTRAASINGRVLAQSLTAAACTGLVTAWLATALAWVVRVSRWRSISLLVLATALAITPGPILGLGLKKVILLLVGWEKSISPDFAPLGSLLYTQPSPLPLMLAGLLRFLPVALLIVVPVVRSLSQDLLDQCRVEGGSAWRLVGKPGTARATLLAAIAVAGLSLGEVSAGKLVATPGWRMFILDLFDQMHYGAEPLVAALALVQILLTALLAAIASLAWRRGDRRAAPSPR